ADKAARKWCKLISDYCLLFNPIERRGGAGSLARRWGDDRIGRAIGLVERIIANFSGVRDGFEECLAGRDRSGQGQGLTGSRPGGSSTPSEAAARVDEESEQGREQEEAAKAAKDWCKLIDDYCLLFDSFKRRGGSKQLARPWSDERIGQMIG